jgi:hypothetical protein
MIDVRLVTDRRSRRQFIDLPYRKYRGDPHWIPPARLTEVPQFDPARNPFLAVADMDLFLGWDGDRIVGRIAAIDDHRHNEQRHENLAAFGFFEADTAEAAAALFATVERWAAARGRSTLRGPLSPSLNYVAGLQIDAFDTDPFVMMACNPPEYVGYVEDAGFRKAKDLYCWLLDLRREDVRYAAVAERIRRRYSVTIRPVDFSRLRRESDTMYAIYCDAWEQNWGFVPPTREEFWGIVKDLRLLRMRDAILIAEVDGRPVGCITVIPDVNQVLKGTNARLLPTGWYRLLTMKRRVTRGRLMTAGMIEEYRERGVVSALMAEVFRVSRRLGFTELECSWILEDNHLPNHSLRKLGATMYKTYRLYEKRVPAAARADAPARG